MKNNLLISGMSIQISTICASITSLCNEIENVRKTGDAGLIEVYESLILNEVGHMQVLTLELTKQITGGANADDSVFAEGELNSNIGARRKEDPE